MHVNLNGRDIEIPFDPLLIPLNKFIAYQKEYGYDLDKKLIEIVAQAKADEDFDIMAMHEEHVNEEAIAWFSFWADIEIGETKQIPNILQYISKYYNFRYILTEGTDVEKIYPQVFDWEGDKWVVQDFKLNPASEMTFNEIITSKEVIRLVKSLEKGKWESMISLCCIFFRKEGEQFTDSLVYEGGERSKLLSNLPLTYALSVGFFLSTCVSIWSKSLAFSPNPKEELETKKLSLSNTI